METSQAHFTKYMKENFANTSTYQKKENIPIQDTITNKEKMKETGINFEYRKRLNTK